MEGAKNRLVLFVSSRCVYRFKRCFVSSNFDAKYQLIVIKTIVRSTIRYMLVTNVFALFTTLSNVACNILTQDFVFPWFHPCRRKMTMNNLTNVASQNGQKTQGYLFVLFLSLGGRLKIRS